MYYNTYFETTSMTTLANSVIFTEASLSETRQLPNTTCTDNNVFLKAAVLLVL
jgi:hypothetical protein